MFIEFDPEMRFSKSFESQGTAKCVTTENWCVSLWSFGKLFSIEMSGLSSRISSISSISNISSCLDVWKCLSTSPKLLCWSSTKLSHCEACVTRLVLFSLSTSKLKRIPMRRLIFASYQEISAICLFKNLHTMATWGLHVVFM